jgi:hypothetical protein
LLTQGARPALATVFHALQTSNPVAMLISSEVPQLANLVLGSTEAPDISVSVTVNGKQVLYAPKVQDSYSPTWGGLFSQPLQLNEGDQIDVAAVDQDLLKVDNVGVCTSDGPPNVDRLHYATADTFRCSGQLWGIALRVLPVQPAAPMYYGR